MRYDHTQRAPLYLILIGVGMAILVAAWFTPIQIVRIILLSSGGVLLWIARLVLLAAVALHIWAAWQVTRMSRQARPARYARRGDVQASYASRTMRWGGVIVLAFVVYHLLHFTTGSVHPDFHPGDVYANVVRGFRVWWVSAFYIVAQVLLGFHLYHGLWSMFQSLGWNHPRFNHWRSAFAHAFAWIVTLGNISFPLAVLAGVIHL